MSDAKSLPVGEPGERDEHLFYAALQLVRARGQSPDVAEKLLLEFYCPRVPLDGQDTVSPARVAYKCQEAVLDGTWSLQPLTQEDVDLWVELSKKHLEQERKERLRLTDPNTLPIPEHDPDYQPLRAKDMVPLSETKGIEFTNLANILATQEEWAGRLYFDEFAEEFHAFEPPVAMEDKGFFTDEDVSSVRLWFSSR